MSQILAFSLMASAVTGVGQPTTEIATFAGGCFWCMQPPFDALDGVVGTSVGYMGGHVENPAYEQVSRGETGHAEAIRIEFRPDRVSYETLLEVFWRNIDPTTTNRQFCDVGSQYRSAIFVQNESQRAAAVRSKSEVERRRPFPEPIVTEVVDADTFYTAEEYHQAYYRKDPVRYKMYRKGCGDARLAQLWNPEK